MKRVVSVFLLLLVLGACTTERGLGPTDTERASELNAQLGLEYMRHGDFKRASEKLDKALQFNPDNANALHYKAELNRRLGEFKKAEEHYKRALELDPSNATVLNNYGVFLCDSGEYSKAIEHFTTILDDPLYSQKASAYENIGLCELRRGHLKKADDAFTHALKLNPRMAKSLINIAQLRYDSGRKKESYEYFKRYLQLAPHTPESLWLGILLESERGGKNAIASYKVILKGKFPDSSQARLLKKLEAQGKI